MPAPDAAQVVTAAARSLHACRRVDMGSLARELGTSRVTLHRRVGSREQLLGEAFWLLASRTFADAEQRWDAGPQADRVLRSLWVMREFRYAVAHHAGTRHFLDEEPALAMRLLTDPRGRVQPRVIDTEARLLQRDVDAGLLHPLVDVPTLAYAVVRLGESFLYADVLASRTPDLEACTTLVDALVTAVPRAAGRVTAGPARPATAGPS